MNTDQTYRTTFCLEVNSAAPSSRHSDRPLLLRSGETVSPMGISFNNGINGVSCFDSCAS